VSVDDKSSSDWLVEVVAPLDIAAQAPPADTSTRAIAAKETTARRLPRITIPAGVRGLPWPITKRLLALSRWL
jgi:hypothetical protein